MKFTNEIFLAIVSLSVLTLASVTTIGVLVNRSESKPGSTTELRVSTMRGFTPLDVKKDIEYFKENTEKMLRVFDEKISSGELDLEKLDLENFRELYSHENVKKSTLILYNIVCALTPMFTTDEECLNLASSFFNESLPNYAVYKDKYADKIRELFGTVGRCIPGKGVEGLSDIAGAIHDAESVMEVLDKELYEYFSRANTVSNFLHTGYDIVKAQGII